MSADGNDQVKRGTSDTEEYGTIEEHTLVQGRKASVQIWRWEQAGTVSGKYDVGPQAEIGAS